MRSYFILLLVFLTVVFLFSGCVMEQNGAASSQKNLITQNVAPDKWQNVAAGLDYKDVNVSQNLAGDDRDRPLQDGRPLLNFLLARVDPEKFVFRIYQNKNAGKTIQEIHQSIGSLLTFNGSFFDENFKAIGLLISENKKFNNFSRAKLMNGVFALNKDNKVKFYYPPRDISRKDYDFAIQNGPVLIDQNGRITIHSETGQKASRTAIGLDKNGNVIIIAIKQNLFNSENAVSLAQFANLLKSAPELKILGLRSVLNLDGGASTGIMINNHYLPELSQVQNVVTVFRKYENNK